VVRAFTSHLEGEATPTGLNVKSVTPTYRVTLGELADRIASFREVRHRLMVPDLQDRLNRCLYATYLSYLNEGAFSYALETRSDARGALAELLKSDHFGQIFISRTKPGVTRGNHYHDSKVEKFCVLEGEARIRLRRILDGKVCEYEVKGSDFKIVDIPPGYAHSIENVGKTEMIVLFWADEIFDQENPDTYASKVLP
jgi:UDP-2-acetamido-2,6-beta-L-arabino-hexul-4-ose reductase